MCDRRELDKLREQRDDAIGRAVTTLQALQDSDATLYALADVLVDVTFELAETTSRLEAVLALIDPDNQNADLNDDANGLRYFEESSVRAATSGAA